MDENAGIERKRRMARAGALIFIIALGLRIYQIATGGTAVAAAAEVTAAAPSPPPPLAADSGSGAATAGQPTTFAYVAWLNNCDPTQTQLGLYAAGDVPCQPGRTVSLTWLQSQLTAAGMLASGEYLEQAANLTVPACFAAILTRADGLQAGWLCSDARGLYRTDASGTDLGGRWQVWSQ